MGISTSVYLTELQHERLQAMATSQGRSASNLIAYWLDVAWTAYLQGQAEATTLAADSPTEEQCKTSTSN